MTKVGPDPNFKTVLKLAREQKIARGKLVCRKKLTPRLVSHIIIYINPLLINGQDLRAVSKRKIQDRLNRIACFLAIKIGSDMSDVDMRRLKCTALWLWYGCLASAKTISYKTRSGVNTPNVRLRTLKRLDRMARKNNVIELGIKAAPYFKRHYRQKVYYNGIPKDIVKRYYTN